MVELKAAVDAPDAEGATPCYRAAANGCVEAVRVLAELGADVNGAGSGSVEPCTRMLEWKRALYHLPYTCTYTRLLGNTFGFSLE